ncbi:helix-turn-helix transcriptional regulator [Sulfuriferula sp.]|uniref:helix-turn-helix transcriptional regulator n=1 Tax=Sulfuriferula sp. TaxID=2025307 RepID=UPI00272FD45C|nr:helix-turn-helix transcriptional regulator [Sulfuriferula sp.]MDP2027776.1 helix-turn-helix transcriptional regulator [Sulfuriferula sp.]
MIYPIKTLSQFHLVLKGFRKEKGLTQAAMAEKLGITQQSYAYFEANPAAATLERLFMVLRMLNVEISLDQTSPATSMGATPSVKVTSKRPSTVKAMVQKISKTPRAVVIGKKKPSAVAKVGRIVAPTRKKESW